MELIAVSLIRGIILPPGILLVLLVLALMLLKRKPVIARLLIVLVLISGYLLSTPWVSGQLIAMVETYPALKPEDLAGYDAGAIVILSSDREKNAQEFGHDSVGINTLVRCRYGAFLHHRTGLPVVVSGGWVIDRDGESLAQVMADLLTREKTFRLRLIIVQPNDRGECVLYPAVAGTEKNRLRIPGNSGLAHAPFGRCFRDGRPQGDTGTNSLQERRALAVLGLASRYKLPARESAGVARTHRRRLVSAEILIPANRGA